MPATPTRYSNAMRQTQANRPIVNVICSAVAWPKPRSVTTSVMSGAMSDQTGPLESPSNVVDPIITQSSATVPGTGVSHVTPLSGGRTWRAPRSHRSGDMRAKSPK
jgi:hypothetical protein